MLHEAGKRAHAELGHKIHDQQLFTKVQATFGYNHSSHQHSSCLIICLYVLTHSLGGCNYYIHSTDKETEFWGNCINCWSCKVYLRVIRRLLIILIFQKLPHRNHPKRGNNEALWNFKMSILFYSATLFQEEKLEKRTKMYMQGCSMKHNF